MEYILGIIVLVAAALTALYLYEKSERKHLESKLRNQRAVREHKKHKNDINRAIKRAKEKKKEYENAKKKFTNTFNDPDGGPSAS